MKKIFYNLGNFMYRRPTAKNVKLEYSAEDIRQACSDPAFREKVYIASPALLDMMDMYIDKQENLSEKKLMGLKVSVMKYLIRSRTRTTPFGLFSAVGTGKFDRINNFSKLQTWYSKKVKIDIEWLFGLITNLESTYAEKLEFKFNDACYIKGNRAILLYSSEKNTEEVSVRYTGVFRVLQDSIKDYEHFNQVISILQNEYQETPIAKIKSYLKELISKGFLISKLRPSFNEAEPELYFIDICREVGLTEISTKVTNILCMIEEYEQTAIGEGILKYNEIVAAMKEIFQSSSYLQVDTIIEGSDFKLTSDIANEINELASLFVYLSNPVNSNHSNLEQYKNKFVEKYGVDREVPLLEMLDTNIGIGAPAMYLKPQNDFYDEYTAQANYNRELKNYLLEKYEMAVAEGRDIIIDMEEIKQFLDCSVKVGEVPVSLELYFMLKQKDGKICMSLSPNCGSFVAGKTFGRFSVLSEEFADILKKCNCEERKIRDEEVELCEISFLPSPIRSGNIVRTLTFRDKETAIFTNGNKNTKDRISLGDIYIGINSKNKFYARNYSSGRLTIFESNNMYNPMLNPNALRFLQEISYEGTRSWSEFPWDYVYSEFRHVPAIKYKNITIQNERWKLSWKDMNLLKNSYLEFKEKLKSIIAERNIPSEIYIVDADNRIKLDLNSELSLHIVYDELKKHKENDLIFEKTEAGEDIVYDDGGFYASEIVVPLFRKNKENVKSVEPKKLSFPKEDHIILPFDNWLYLKLYCNHNREEELIAFDIMDFCDSLRERYGIDYFFMRYVDPKPHVRLRFHAPQVLLLQVYPEIMNWYSQMFKNQIVGNINISVYDREIERYGGKTLIKYAENVFFKDSYIVEKILRLKRLGKLQTKLEDIAIMSTIMYVMQFFEEYDEQLRFLTVNYHTSEFGAEFKKRKEYYLHICDFEKNWENLKEKEEGRVLLEILNERNDAINIYRQQIIKENRNYIYINGIVASVIHLHCNRLIGTNRELERKLMSFAESIVYAKKYIMKGGTQNGKRDN